VTGKYSNKSTLKLSSGASIWHFLPNIPTSRRLAEAQDKFGSFRAANYVILMAELLFAAKH